MPVAQPRPSKHPLTHMFGRHTASSRPPSMTAAAECPCDLRRCWYRWTVAACELRWPIYRSVACENKGTVPQQPAGQGTAITHRVGSPRGATYVAQHPLIACAVRPQKNLQASGRGYIHTPPHDPPSHINKRDGGLYGRGKCLLEHLTQCAHSLLKSRLP